MVKIFFGNRSYALLALPLLIVGYVFLNYWKQYHIAESTAHFGFWGAMLDQNNIFSQISAGTLIFLNAILLNIIFNRNEFMERNIYLPALIYVSAMSFFHCFYFIDGFALSQTLLILALYQGFRLNQNEDGRRTVFNMTFLIGVACTLNPMVFVSVPFIFWMVWVIRPFIFRESVLGVIGYTIPVVYAGLYSSVFDIKVKNKTLSSSSFQGSLEDAVIIIGFVLLLLVFSLKPFLSKLQKSSIRFKKLIRVVMILLFFTLVFSVLEYFFWRKTEALGLIFAPIAFVLTYAFGEKTQRIAPTIVFYLMILFSVGKFLMPLSFLSVE